MTSKQTRRTLGLVMAGAGMILVGVFSLLWMAPATGNAVDLDVVPVDVSYPAPSLRLNDLQGKPTDLEDYLGQVVLVNLWATWCPPCKQEMPALQAFYDEYKGDGFTVIAINDGESSEAVTHFVAEYRLTFPVWLDLEYIATDKAFQTSNLPSSFVIDRQGTIRLRWVGGIDLSRLSRYVTPLILE